MAKIMRSLKERFDEKYIPEPTSGCWIWEGPYTNGGYGKISTNHGYKNNKTSLAHRVSYLLNCGSIPKGMCVCHKCDVRACVNPNHLFLGTILDNVTDMITKGKHFYKDIERCKYGHYFSESNTRIRKDGSRACRKCSSSYGYMYRAKSKAQK